MSEEIKINPEEFEKKSKDELKKELSDLEYAVTITKVLYLNGSECDFANPLPILLSHGKSCNTGNWVGDEISTSDEMPKDYVFLTEIYLDW